MATFYDSKNDFRNYLQHYGVKGMRWRNRRASSRNVDDQRNRHRVNLSEGSSWNANGTDRRHRRNDSDQESPETGRQNGHYYNRNSWLQRQHDETIHDHDRRVEKGRAQDEGRNRALNKLKGRRLNKGAHQENIPYVDDKSLDTPIRQRRQRELGKFGRNRRRH